MSVFQRCHDTASTKRIYEKLESLRENLLEKLPPRTVWDLPQTLTGGDSSRILVHDPELLIRINPTRTEQEVVKNQEISTTVFYGDAGVGKSELLFQVARTIFQGPSYDVGIIPTILQWCNLGTTYKSWRYGGKQVISAIRNKLFDQTDKSKGNKFFSLLKTSNGITLHLFFDGFDLVPSDLRGNLLKILQILVTSEWKVRLWITCHEDVVESLKNFLQTEKEHLAAYYVQPLKPNDGILVVQQFLMSKDIDIDVDKIKEIVPNVDFTLGESCPVLHAIMVSNLVEEAILCGIHSIQLVSLCSLLESWVNFKLELGYFTDTEVEEEILLMHIRTASMQIFHHFPLLRMTEDADSNAKIVKTGLLKSHDRMQLINSSVAEYLVSFYIFFLFSRDDRKHDEDLIFLLFYSLEIDKCSDGKGIEFKHFLLVHCINDLLKRHPIQNPVPDPQIFITWDLKLFAKACALVDYYPIFKAFTQRFKVVGMEHRNAFSTEWLSIVVRACCLDFVKLAVELWKGAGNMPTTQNICEITKLFQNAALRRHPGIFCYLHSLEAGLRGVIAHLVAVEDESSFIQEQLLVAEGLVKITGAKNIRMPPKPDVSRVPTLPVPGPATVPAHYPLEYCASCFGKYNYTDRRKITEDCGCTKCHHCMIRSEKGCIKCYRSEYNDEEIITFNAQVGQVEDPRIFYLKALCELIRC